MNNGTIETTERELRAEYKKSKEMGILTEKSEKTWKRLITRARRESVRNAQIEQKTKNEIKHAKRKEREMLEDETGTIATLRIIGYIRDADNGVDGDDNPMYIAMMGWTGYDLTSSHDRHNMLALLNLWEREVRQENYIAHALGDEGEEKIGRYCIRLESLSGAKDDYDPYGAF